MRCKEKVFWLVVTGRESFWQKIRCCGGGRRGSPCESTRRRKWWKMTRNLTKLFCRLLLLNIFIWASNISLQIQAQKNGNFSCFWRFHKLLLFLETRRCFLCFPHKNLVEMENNNFESFSVVFSFDVFTFLISDERSDIFPQLLSFNFVSTDRFNNTCFSFKGFA